MRVFMLGWEFPPFISGGLGTACYGLTKGNERLGDRRTVLSFRGRYPRRFRRTLAS